MKIRKTSFLITTVCIISLDQFSLRNVNMEMSGESELEEMRAVRRALDGVRSAACATDSADEDVRDAWNRFDAFFQQSTL